MNRVIKFRLWDEVDGLMREAALLKWDDGHTLSRVAGWYPPAQGVGFHQAWVDAEPPYRYKVMQFTGLLDKNGTEIYDGDILEVEQNYAPKYRSRIEWTGHAFWLTDSHGQSYMPVEKNRTVVGNIYENPELVK